VQYSSGSILQEVVVVSPSKISFSFSLPNQQQLKVEEMIDDEMMVFYSTFYKHICSSMKRILGV
jgi:hypothetical protein